MTLPTKLTDNQLIEHLVARFARLSGPNTKILSIVGGPGSGKTALATMLNRALPHSDILLTDSYLLGDRAYRKELERKHRDPIEKYDFEFLKKQVYAIKGHGKNKSTKVPTYDAATGIAIGVDPLQHPDQNGYIKQIGHVDYLIIEGDFQPLPRREVDCLLYLDVPDNVRLANRMHRDLREAREISTKAIKKSFYDRQLQFETYTAPHKLLADIVVKVNASEIKNPTGIRKYTYTYSLSEFRPGAASYL